MKVKCIKNVDSFKYGNCYEVFIEFLDSYWIYDDNYDEIKFYKNPNFSHNLKFSNYFEDIQKIRKEKLDKLNSVSNNLLY